jgi:hypothetical protein
MTIRELRELTRILKRSHRISSPQSNAKKEMTEKFRDRKMGTGILLPAAFQLIPFLP